MNTQARGQLSSRRRNCDCLTDLSLSQFFLNEREMSGMFICEDSLCNERPNVWAGSSHIAFKQHKAVFSTNVSKARIF